MQIQAWNCKVKPRRGLGKNAYNESQGLITKLMGQYRGYFTHQITRFLPLPSSELMSILINSITKFSKFQKFNQLSSNISRGHVGTKWNQYR